MKASGGRRAGYRARLFYRYLAVSLLPSSFFIILGATAIVVSRNFVIGELRGVERRTLDQVSAGVEMVFSEADSLALSLSTDPELISSLEYGLSVGIPSLADLRKARAVQSSFASAVNSRRYLHSIYATTFADNPAGRMMASSEGIADFAAFPDSAWLASAEPSEDVMVGWTRLRRIRLLTNMDHSIPGLSLYRYLIGPGDLKERGILAINVDLRYVAQMMAAAVAGSFADREAGGAVLIDRSTGEVAAGKALPAETAAAIVAGASGGAFRSEGPMRLGAERYFVSAVNSARFPFTYVLLTPERSFNRVPYKIVVTALAFAVLAMAIGGALTYVAARRNFALLGGILDIIDAAGSGKELPPFRASKNEALDYVGLSVLQTFVEHDYYKVKLSEQELRRRTLELLALQAQMSPHFLFNTLTAISFKAMALTGKPNDLTRMVDHLSSILGYALEDPRTLVTLREEAEHARHYAEIQKLRFKDALRCDWELEDAALDAVCPRLLLQPLVENAAEHGRKTTGKPVSIRVSASLRGGTVVIGVSDDGAGIGAEKLAEIAAEAESEEFSVEHIGLINTLKRMRLTFGAECSYRLLSERGSGTTVELTLPYRPYAPEPSGESAEEGPPR